MQRALAGAALRSAWRGASSPPRRESTLAALSYARAGFPIAMSKFATPTESEYSLRSALARLERSSSRLSPPPVRAWDQGEGVLAAAAPGARAPPGAALTQLRGRDWEFQAFRGSLRLLGFC